MNWLVQYLRRGYGFTYILAYSLLHICTFCYFARPMSYMVCEIISVSEKRMKNCMVENVNNV